MSVAGYTHVSLELWGSVFCLIASLTVSVSDGKNNPKRRKLIMIQLVAALLLLSDSFAWLFRGAEGTLGYYMVRISNYLVFESNYMISMVFAAYLTDYLEESGSVDRRWFGVLYAVGGTGMIFMTVSQFNHMYYYFDAGNTYHRASMYWLCLVFGILESVIFASILIRYRKLLKKKELALFSSFIVLAALALVIQLFFYGVMLTNIAIMISTLMMFVSYIADRSVRLAEQERKMGEMQVQLVLSQIQPHFIYNTLNSIYYLCGKDPMQAQKAVNWFAELLRSNMDSMRRNTPVTFEQEFKALDNYLKLEKMRFEEELRTEFDIRATDFLLPPMTLQPIVENAVKHGLGKKPGGGTVTIRSFERENEYTVMICDDGTGYAPEENEHDGRTHTGIENVRARLWSMCRGTLEINGKKDEGTTVVIHIPKENI